MPDIFGNPTEAELRGQWALPRGLFDHHSPPDAADLQARDAAAQAGMGTGTHDGQTLTGDAFRASTDPSMVALREQMLGYRREAPNLGSGADSGRQQSQQDRDYRH